MPAHEPAAFAAQSALLSRHIRALLPVGAHVLVAGLGNEAVTPDAVGPEALRNLIVTRHLKRTMPEVFAPFSTVSAIAPGVLGTTGMESVERQRAILEQQMEEIMWGIQEAKADKAENFTIKQMEL